ncbi:MAG: hypothetical protein JJU36_09935 [Phycisphaeraceae bacterium]|nr:hypothetical protein [Phycisphaeraceae bacterium]
MMRPLAHSVNNALGTVFVQTYLARRHLDSLTSSDADLTAIVKALDALDAAAQREADLLKRIQELGRVEVDGFEPIDLAALIDSACQWAAMIIKPEGGAIHRGPVTGDAAPVIRAHINRTKNLLVWLMVSHWRELRRPLEISFAVPAKGRQNANLVLQSAGSFTDQSTRVESDQPGPKTGTFWEDQFRQISRLGSCCGFRLSAARNAGAPHSLELRFTA